MTTMRLVAAERLEPKGAFRCVACDPPTRKRFTAKRYRFTLVDDRGEGGAHCLPCAAPRLDLPQGELRRQADATRAETGVRR